MQLVESNHPPGGIVMISGEIYRYSLSARCYLALNVPEGSQAFWQMGCLISKMLNLGIQQSMENPVHEWVWIMGDDHTYAPQVITNLLDRDKDVILPLCLNRHAPLDPTIGIWTDSEHTKLKHLETLPTEGLYKLAENETTGDSGMLIRRHVLEKIGFPWYRHRKSGGWDYNAEDQAFNALIREAGYDIWIDLDNRIGHIMTVTNYAYVREGKWRIGLETSSARLMELTPSRPLHYPEITPGE